MKIQIDGKEIFEISETKRKVYCNEINEGILISYLAGKLQDDLDKLSDKMYANLKTEWDKKLISEGVKLAPLSRDDYAEYIFARPDYKPAKDR